MSERRILLLLFVVTLGLRVLYGATVAPPPQDIADHSSYDLRQAQRITSGWTWLTTPYSPKAPGYHTVLAAFYLLGAKKVWLILFWQAVLAALTVCVVYRLARHLMGPLLAAVSGLWFALSVHHMQYTVLFTRDVVVVLLFITLLFLLVRPFRAMRFAALAGFIFVLLIHVDPQFILLFPVLAAFVLFFKTRHNLLNVQYFFVFATAALLLSVPWTIRNTIVYGQPVPVALEATRYLRPLNALRSGPDETLSDLADRVEFARDTNRVSINSIEFWRFARFSEGSSFHSDPWGSTLSVQPPWSLRHNLVSILGYGLLLPFFLFGTALAARRGNAEALMLAAAALTYFILRAYLGGSERARLVIDPVIIVLAFYGIAAITDWFAARTTATTE